MSFSHRKAVAVLATIVLSSGALIPRPHVLARSPAADAPKTPEVLIPPLPERKPERPLVPLHPGEVETPDWTAQQIQQAVDRCASLLQDKEIVFKILEPLRQGRCGAPAPIELSTVASTVRIEPPARVRCGLATKIHDWVENVIQISAQKYFGEDIKAIRNVASYVCRNRYNSTDKPISEHARANALDMAAFQLQSGRWITVMENWSAILAPEPPVLSQQSPHEPSGPNQEPEKTEVIGATGTTEKNQADDKSGSEPSPPLPEPVPAIVPTPESNFLREIHAGGCKLFGTVLGPEANESHKDHFHYDMAKREYGNFCE